MDFMNDSSEKNVSEIAAAVGFDINQARYVLSELERDGLIRSRRCEIAGCNLYRNCTFKTEIDKAKARRWV